ncbi:MAG: acetyl-CoA carboxylase biotin carboxyl carrier protein [Acidobacteriota bacterium]
MTIQEIKELLDLFNTSGVAEMEVQRGENRVRFRRGGVEVSQVVPVAAPVIAAAPVAATPVVAAPAAPVVDESTIVKSPIVGTFYESPSPDAPPFVKVGDSVEKGQVLCIIESMKLMNEIESEVAGTIVARLVENARPVEYGEPLFSVKPR